MAATMRRAAMAAATTVSGGAGSRCWSGVGVVAVRGSGGGSPWAVTPCPTPAAAGALGGVRHFGILDRIRGGFSAGAKEKQEEKKREIFQQQLQFLATSPTYTMADHMKVLDDTAEKAGMKSTWQSMLRTSSQQAELEEQMLDLKIGAVLSPAELADPTIIHRREKLRIASAVGVDVSRVNKFLDAYEQSVVVHKWLAGRKAKGLPLPTTLEQYFAFSVADKVGSTGRKNAMSTAQLGNVRSMRAMLRKG